MNAAARLAPTAGAPGGSAVLSLRAVPPARFDVTPEYHPLAAEDAHAALEQRLALLLHSAAQGDARAFEAFYSLTLGLASALVRRLAGSNHVEDVLSDSYFQAWRQAGRFEPQRGSAITWLMAIARSRALDRLRAEKLRHAGLSGAPDPGDDEIEDELQCGPDTLLENTQESNRLHGAMAQLSANERWVLGLAYYRELSHGEIASITDLPLGTVKSLIRRSQQKLRQVIETAGSPHSALHPS